jgi:hypothetical protein
MKQPSILDVVRAVKQTSPAYATVNAWWYAPPERMRLAGASELGTSSELEVVVEAAPASEVDCARIASAIAAALRVPSVRVRAHRGLEEARALFRLLSTGERRGVSPGGGVDS